MPPFTPPEPAAPLSPTAEPLPPPVAPPAGPLAFLDRDHSILAFNERVFHWAERSDVPLLERGFYRLHAMVTRVGERRAISPSQAARPSSATPSGVLA